MFTQMAWRVAAASRRRKLHSLAVAHQLRAARRLFGAKAALASAMLLSACTWFSPDAGMGVVATIAQQELKKDVATIRSSDEAEAAAATVRRLLGRALTADAAVQIALLNNRGLQAAYDELAIADAERVGQSLPPNPTFSWRRIQAGPALESEMQLVTNIIALATLPARSELAAERFHQAQLRAAEETLRVAHEARRAYYRAVAARELVPFLTESQSAAETATRLAARLGETGAMNKLDQAREQVFYADLTAQLTTARQREASEREALIRAMGLGGSNLDFKLPNALPPVPRRVQTLAGIEVDAVARRVDLQIARIELDVLAKSYGLTQATRFINILDGGYTDKLEKRPDERFLMRGFDVRLQIPVFDFGEVRVRQAEAIYMQAANRLLELAVNARSEARDAYRIYRSTYDIAGHYQREVLPLRKIISDETLLRYNAMLIDVFSLLAEARQRIAATITAIEAKRDFWLATVDLKAAIAGGGRSSNRYERANPAAVSAGAAGAR
jgi:outer membrane protein TolC